MASLKPAEKLVLLTILFVVLNAADWAMTMYGLSRGAVEGNPLVRGSLNDLASVAAIKLVGLPLLFAAMYGAVFTISRIMKRDIVTKIVLETAVTVNIIYLGVILNNIIVNIVIHFFA